MRESIKSLLEGVTLVDVVEENQNADYLYIKECEFL